jgi:N6-L-threonylcarbamoyladenine synthase
VLYYVQRNKAAIEKGEVTVNDIAAAFQKSIVRSISNKMRRIYEEYKIKSIAISGGVAANGYLKDELKRFAKDHNMTFFVPSMKLCTDNGAMIAYTGWQYLKNGVSSGMDLEIQPDMPALNSK